MASPRHHQTGHPSLSARATPARRPPESAHGTCFTVVHYAGIVIYTIANFLEKNKDTLHRDLFLVATLGPAVSPRRSPSVCPEKWLNRPAHRELEGDYN